jgi:dTDP-4-dehydrorhamnose 3,5-epimerase
MKILSVEPLVIPDLRLIRFARYLDGRGHFAEPFRKSVVASSPVASFLDASAPVQMNESFSRAGTFRGLHFQWNPYMGKLVRTVSGRMIDLALDIRVGSPYFGCIMAVDMPAARERAFGEWIWVPAGFAHGNIFTEETIIEYLCTGEHNPACEVALSVFSTGISWSLCEPRLAQECRSAIAQASLISAKDRNALSLQAWTEDPRSSHFLHPLVEPGLRG